MSEQISYTLTFQTAYEIISEMVPQGHEFTLSMGVSRDFNGAAAQRVEIFIEGHPGVVNQERVIIASHWHELIYQVKQHYNDVNNKQSLPEVTF